MKTKDIKIMHLQNLIDSLNKKYGTLKLIKAMLNQLFKYAMELDIIQKDYSKYLKIGKSVIIKQKSIFTDDEINLLWSNLENFKYVDTILIMIYTGVRISELLNLKKEERDNLINSLKTNTI